MTGDGSLPLEVEMHWAEKFIGKKWSPGTDGPDQFDCWGLLVAIYREQLGINLQPAEPVQAQNRRERRLTIEATIAHSGVFGAWAAVDKPRHLDAVLMGNGDHVGVWLEDQKAVLHSTEGAGVTMAKLNAFRGRGIGFKFFRLKWPSS